MKPPNDISSGLSGRKNPNKANKAQVLNEIYKSHENYLARQSGPPQKLNFEEILGFFFCAGPFYYYILDSPTLTFESVSRDAEKVLGINIKSKPIQVLLENVHPDDMNFLLKCENFVAEFLTTKVTPDKIVKYKISYCIRERVSDGSYRLFLMQSITLASTPEGALLKVLGVHTDISHITTQNNCKISLIGLDGEPSYVGLDLLDRDSADFWKTESILSKRELEVIQLLADGFTAKEIAHSLSVSVETIISHKRNAMAKSDCKNSNQLVAFCIRNGLI